MDAIVILCDSAPVGSNAAVEAIRLGSGVGALGDAVPCKVVFLGDAVHVLLKDATPERAGLDSHDEAFTMADLSDLEILVHDEALAEAGRTREDLIDYANLQVIDMKTIARLVADAPATFRY